MNWKKEAEKHFKQAAPNEGCGLLYEKGGNEFFWPCKNIASYKDEDVSFTLDPKDFAACEDSGADILAVLHSHVDGSSEPSEADVKNFNVFRYDWYIYSVRDNEWHYLETDQ